MCSLKYFVMYHEGDLVHFAPAPTLERALVEMAYLQARQVGRLHRVVSVPDKIVMVSMPLSHSPITEDPTFWVTPEDVAVLEMLGISLEGFTLCSIYRDRAMKIVLEGEEGRECDGS